MSTSLPGTLLPSRAGHCMGDADQRSQQVERLEMSAILSGIGNFEKLSMTGTPSTAAADARPMSHRDMGAPTSLHRKICSGYSLNKCDAWVTAAPARIAAATMAASVSIVSFAPA